MALAGQVTVTTAGTAVQGTDQVCNLIALVAHPDNTDAIWVGNDEANDVTNSNGFPLNANGPPIVMSLAGNLNELWVDADVSGEKLCWLRLN